MGLGFETNTKTKLILIAIEEFYAFSKALNIPIHKDMLPEQWGT